MSKRLEMLEKLVASGKADSFAQYALAMEYRNAGRTDDALAAFGALRTADPDYLPAYLMAGQLLVEASRTSEARGWVEAGIELATRKGDAKARNELAAVLAECD